MIKKLPFSYALKLSGKEIKNLLAFTFIFSSVIAFAQNATLTPVSDIGMHNVAVNVPAKYSAVFPAGKMLSVQSDYTVSVFHAGGLAKPRFMSFSPKGILHVSDMGSGKVLALPDTDNDGIADTVIEAAKGFTGNHDIKFYKGAMYVTEPTLIWKCTDMNDDGIYENKTVFITNIANNETNGHSTRTVVFDSINEKIYVSVGSSCNVCRENHRAIIEQYNEDGTGRKVFSSGVRNAVGMALHPITNKLWANNNGSDQQGNETPPEWIDIVREDGFYGHPFVYGTGVWFDFNAHPQYSALLPITSMDSTKVNKLISPAALIRAHSAPMALEFLNSKASAEMQHGFLTALRGSWNTTAPNNFRGFKVIYGHLSSDVDSTVDYVADFCTGFLTDTVARIFWGRPVGIAIDQNGKVYISSDESNKFIIVLTPSKTSGFNDSKNSDIQIGNIYPNPVKNQFTISLNLTKNAKITAEIFDITGKKISSVLEQNFSAGNHTKQIDINHLASGTYYVKINADHNFVTQKLIVLK